jgi:hypothetical protein
MFDPSLFDADRLSPAASAAVDAVRELAARPKPRPAADWSGLAGSTDVGASDEETLNEVKALAFAYKALGAELGRRLLTVGERNLTVLEGRSTTTSWAAAELLMAPGEARGLVQAAKVSRRLPELGEHYRSGRISTAHMLAADTALGGFPESKVSEADSFLAEHGRSMTTREFAALGQRLRETVVPELVADELDNLPDAARLSCSPIPGGIRVSGVIYGVDADTVQAGIDRMSVRLPDDHRSAEKRRADALALLCRVGMSADLHARDLVGTGYTPTDLPKTAVNVTVDLITLRRAFERDAAEAAARLGDPVLSAFSSGWMPAAEQDLLRGAAAERTGTAVGWRELVTAFCDSEISRLVLGPDSEVLDLGQAARLFNRRQRRALARGRTGCQWPRCDMPWVEADHVDAFKDGGATDVSNGRLLCAFHHGLRHRGWRLEEDLETGELQAIKPRDWAQQLAKSRRRTRQLRVA